MMFESFGLDPARLYASFVDLVLVKATMVVSVAAIACYVARRASASTRHAIWATAFCALLALPALHLAAPEADLTLVGVRAPAPTEIPPSDVRPISAVGSRPVVASSRAPKPIRPIVSESSRPLATVSIATAYRWVVGVWLVGLLVLLGRFTTHVAARRRLATERASPELETRVRTLAQEIGLRRAPRTVLSRDMSVPSAFGMIRPTVLLPAEAAVWPSEAFDAAVLHELGHLRRRDYVTYVVASIVRAVYWVNPFVLLAARRLDLERERACDDGVVTGRIDPIRYAECLMRLAWAGREPVHTSALSFARRSSLPERVRSLLDRAQKRAPLTAGRRFGILAFAAVALVPVVSIDSFGIVRLPAQAIGSLSHPDPLVRRHAAWALGDAESVAGVDALLERLDDPDPRVRAVAAWALGEIKDPRAIEPLGRLLLDDHRIVRELAVLAIGEIEDPTALPVLRELGPEVASETVRAWAIAEILAGGEGRDLHTGELTNSGFGSADRARLVAELSDEDPRVRAVAAERLGRLGDPDAVEALLDAIADEDPTVRATAVWALDEINAARPPG